MPSTDIALDEWLATRIAAQARGARVPYVVGLCGPQGSGKSTLANACRTLLLARGLGTAVLSLDDLYLTHAERQELSRRVHPLLATRGVPGTHDVALGMSLLDALGREGSVELPSFDKSRDDRRPRAEWQHIETPVSVVLFEGWCVGARPQASAALASPINELERAFDTDGRWRHHVNAALGDEYQTIFGRLDQLILLKPPSFDVVFGWRREQEMALRDSATRGDSRVMTDAELLQFIQHYERLTRHILEEMPHRADVVVEFGAKRTVEAIRCGEG